MAHHAEKMATAAVVHVDRQLLHGVSQVRIYVNQTAISPEKTRLHACSSSLAVPGKMANVGRQSETAVATELLGHERYASVVLMAS